MPHHRVSDQLVAKFWELFSNLNSYSDAWSQLHDWSIADGEARGLRNPGQGWNSASGTAFEIISRRIIGEQIEGSHLSATVQLTTWKDTHPDIRNGILSEVVWPKGQIARSQKAESNVDLVATLNENDDPVRVIGVYSCKTSTAERYQQDLYWAEKLKARGIRFCFVTIEKGLVEYATAPSAPENPNKTVVLSQALYDRIYLLTDHAIIQNRSVFRGIDGVVDDMDLWIRAY